MRDYVHNFDIHICTSTMSLFIHDLDITIYNVKMYLLDRPDLGPLLSAIQAYNKWT